MTKTRVLAALVMAPLVIAAVLFLRTAWLMPLVTLLCLLAMWEWTRLVDIEDNLARYILLACNLTLMVALVWGSRSAQTGALPLFEVIAVLGVAWWLLALLWLLHYDFASGPGGNSRIFKLIAGTAAIIPAWCALALIHRQTPNGPFWLLLALLLVWAADSGAYFAGRRFGGRWFSGRKLAPRVSPNKTIEGLLGGLVLSAIVAVAGAFLLHVPMQKLPAVIGVALATVVFSVIGDLFESLLKRHAGVKDSGTLIPGHGGILDRVDSLLAALPMFAVGKALVGF